MKVWLYSLLGLVLFCAVGIGVQIYISKNALNIDQDLKQAQSLLKHRKWPETSAALKKAQTKWHKTKSVWAVLTRHFEIDAIDQALIKTEKAVESKSYPKSVMELGSLRQLVKHVPEREKLSLVNVF